MSVPEKLEGWKPEPAEDLPLTRLIDLAFDYRGDTTLLLHDGRSIDGYLFNKNAAAPEPYVQVYLPGKDAPERVSYAAIRTVHFTGKDTAA